MADTFNKRFDVSDVFVSPYEANKRFDITSSLFDSYNVTFDVATKADLTLPKNQYTTENLLYQSVLSNYYPEYYPTQSHSTSSYYQTNNLNSTLKQDIDYNALQRLGNGTTTQKYIPTETGSTVFVLNIPKNIYYDKVQPGSLTLEVSGGLVYDDGEYNLRWSGPNQSSSINTLLSQSSYVGNIWYEQGLATLTIIPNVLIATGSAVCTTSYFVPDFYTPDVTTGPDNQGYYVCGEE
jgi:hypothetical protein